MHTESVVRVEDMIKRVVIPAAGIGTRLLPATKEQPKEMLPIFVRSFDGELCLKPLLHVIFENLYEVGLREFCFITGRGKRSIEDYFTIDNSFVEYLRDRNKADLAKELTVFYDNLRTANIIFVNQPEPKGFGDAVYRARSFTGTEPFLVHAGDDLIISNRKRYLRELNGVFEKYRPAVAFCVEKVRDPTEYGVILGEKIAGNLYRVRKVLEKPRKPPSNIAIVAVYAFGPEIYEAIEKTPKDANNEVQLTDAIQQLLSENHEVLGVSLNAFDKRIDIGTPLSYSRALSLLVRTKNLV
jgi:UTP--glucose-1-phosphate uridylyltransferase